MHYGTAILFVLMANYQVDKGSENTSGGRPRGAQAAGRGHTSGVQATLPLQVSRGVSGPHDPI